MSKKKPTVLMILDGYGLNDKVEGNAVKQANTPVMDDLMANCPFVEGQASGMAVGLPEGQMGNSEVGHLNMGAGRIVYQELTRITKAIQDGDFFENEELVKAVENAKIGEIPAVMIDEDVHRQMEQYLGGMQQQGISADMYYKLTGTTEEDLHKQFEEGAAKRVKTNLVLEAIVAAEGVTATEEEIDKEIKELAAQYGMDEKAVRSALSDDMLNHDISIRDSAKQVEKD